MERGMAIGHVEIGASFGVIAPFCRLSVDGQWR
jgi:hypothetical protein